MECFVAVSTNTPSIQRCRSAYCQQNRFGQLVPSDINTSISHHLEACIYGIRAPMRSCLERHCRALYRIPSFSKFTTLEITSGFQRRTSPKTTRVHEAGIAIPLARRSQIFVRRRGHSYRAPSTTAYRFQYSLAGYRRTRNNVYLGRVSGDDGCGNLAERPSCDRGRLVVFENLDVGNRISTKDYAAHTLAQKHSPTERETEVLLLILEGNLQTHIAAAACEPKHRANTFEEHLQENGRPCKARTHRHGIRHSIRFRRRPTAIALPTGYRSIRK